MCGSSTKRFAPAVGRGRRHLQGAAPGRISFRRQSRARVVDRCRASATAAGVSNRHRIPGGSFRRGGDHSQDVTWRRRLASSDPLSAGPAKKLILALAAAGDRAGAVKHARQYQELVRQELEMEPDSEIEGLASTLSHPSTTETIVTAAAAQTWPPSRHRLAVARQVSAAEKIPAIPREQGSANGPLANRRADPFSLSRC